MEWRCVSRGGMMEWQPVTENVALVFAELPSLKVLKTYIMHSMCKIAFHKQIIYLLHLHCAEHLWIQMLSPI